MNGPCTLCHRRAESAVRFVRPTLQVLLVTVGLAVSLGSISSHAAEPQALSRGIEPQPLSSALAAFALQTGLQVVYEAKLAANRTSAGARAGMRPNEALASILAGTDLAFEFLNERSVRVYVGGRGPPPDAVPSEAPQAAVPSETPAESLPRIVVIQKRRVLQPPVQAASPKEQRSLEFAAQALDERIEQSNRLYGREDVDRYLQGIADRLLAVDPEPRPPNVRVRTIRDRAANAFTLPNGSIYVTTDLLVRLESEAELACVLGHEISHYVNHHALQHLRARHRTRVITASAAALLGAIIAAGTTRNGVPQTNASQLGRLPQSAVDVWSAAAVSGYARELEREADYEGLRRAAAAGYDAAAGAAAFRHLASAAAPSKGEPAAHFASHPKLIERISSYEDLIASELADAVGPPNIIGRETYEAALAGVDLDQAEVLLSAGETERTAALVAAAQMRRDSARTEYLVGEVARRRVPHSPELDDQAIAAYGRAIGLGNPPPAAYRERGVLLRKRGDVASAQSDFHRYLELDPGAIDAMLVRLYLQPLAASGSAAAKP